MSVLQSIILVVTFFVFYKFIVPRLFPSVVQGKTYVQAGRHKKDDDYGHSKTAGEGNEEDDRVEIRGGFVPLMNSGHRTQAKAQLRRRMAESKYNAS